MLCVFRTDSKGRLVAVVPEEDCTIQKC